MAEELLKTILKEAGGQFAESAGILLIIVSLAYLSSIFTATADLESSGNNDIVSFAVICLIAVPVIRNIVEVVTQAGDTIREIRTIMLSSIPGLCAMNIGTGAAGAATFITITQTVGILLSKVFLPIAVIYAALGICGSVTERFSLEGVKGMVRFLFTWGLGIMMIGFSWCCDAFRCADRRADEHGGKNAEIYRCYGPCCRALSCGECGHGVCRRICAERNCRSRSRRCDPYGSPPVPLCTDGGPCRGLPNGGNSDSPCRR